MIPELLRHEHFGREYYTQGTLSLQLPVLLTNQHFITLIITKLFHGRFLSSHNSFGLWVRVKKIWLLICYLRTGDFRKLADKMNTEGPDLLPFGAL